MTDFASLAEAMTFARAQAAAGLARYPFDAVYRTTMDQLDVIDQALGRAGGLATLPTGSVSVGVMAAKELGADEQDLAHALHVIQRYVDAAQPTADPNAEAPPAR